VTQRVSVDSLGVEGNDRSDGYSISADGRYVAFSSLATNLVPGDMNGTWDVFVRDRLLGTTELVSVDSARAQGSGESTEPRISDDGRYIAFRSDAPNLVPGDTNGSLDIFVRDRLLGTTERVSIDSSSAQGNGVSSSPSISPDCRYVAFHSHATNLVSGDMNMVSDVFVRDRQLGTTERVSVDSGGIEGDSSSDLASISADGRYVAFQSIASNLVPGDTNNKFDVFVRDRQSNATERVSIDSGGAEGDDDSLYPSISSAGQYVGFMSDATNLVVGDANVTTDVFVHDRQSGTTERVSVDSGGTEGDGLSDVPSLSADGRYVSFRSVATNLVGGDTNGFTDVFLRDRQGSTTELVSVDSVGAQGNEHSHCSTISMSPDGRYVLVGSYATNLVLNDTNAAGDVFVRGRHTTPFTSLCHPGVDGVIGCPCGQPANPTGGCANHGAGATSGAVLSGDGSAYLSEDSLILTTSNHRSPAIGVLNVFFSFKPGAVTLGMASGAGVSCIGSGGDLRRLYTMQVFGGTGSKPGMGDLSVSARSATWPAHAISPGETRYYFNVYRDGQASGPCGNPLTSTNLTNMGSIAWSL